MTVTNDFYEFDPDFSPGSKVRADAVNLQFQAIQNAFDFMPSDNEAITTDTSIFAPESGAGNAYVVTMPDTRLSNKDGDGIRFFATHANTGAATIDVDGIGAVALTNWDGTAFVGTEIISGNIYEIRFDASNARFVLAATLDANLNRIYASDWAITPEDTLVPVAAGGDGVSDYSALHWAAKSISAAASKRALTDINTATPPTTEAVTGAHEVWDADETDILARFGFIASNELQIVNYMHGGIVSISHEIAAGTAEKVARSATLATGGFEVNNTFTGAGFERVMTATDQHFIAEQTVAAADVATFGQIWMREDTSGDSLWSEVELHADFDGVDGATAFTEESTNAAVATFGGGAELDTAQFNAGTASLLLDESTSDFVSFPDIAAYDLGSGDWTVEGYARFLSLPTIGFTSDPGYTMAAIFGAAAADQQFNIEVIRDAFGTRLKLSGQGFSEVGTISGGITLGVWYHWAVTRESGQMRAYFNGTYETGDFGAAPTDLAGSTEPFRVGSREGTDRFFDGWIDDVRFTVGTARYTGTGAITPESAPFPTVGPGPIDFMYTDDEGTDFQLNETSGVGASGTPLDNQIAVFTDANTIEGDPEFTWDGITTGITASVTQAQGNGPLVSTFNEVDVVGSGNDTVTLPTAVTGKHCTVINNAALILQIFPASGDDLGKGVNSSTTLIGGVEASVHFFAIDATTWVTVGAGVTGGLSDFSSDTPANNAMLVYDGVADLWEPSSGVIYDGSNFVIIGAITTATGLQGILNVASTATVPNICPSRFDQDTGLGGIADELSLIAGGVEFVRCVESADDYLLVQVPMLIGESAAAVADIAAYGQVWVKDDAPNILMYTDDAGTDFEITNNARWQFVVQTGDDTVNNTTTLIDSELLLTNIPIGRYSLLMVVNARDVAVSGCGMRTDISTTGVGGTSVLRGAVKNFSGSGPPTTDLQGILQDVMLFPSLSTGSGTDQIYYTGTLDVTSGTNTIQVEFAQENAAVGDLDFEAGSSLALTKLD